MYPITFFSGPMRSGKSTRLISELQKNSYRKDTKTVLFRPAKDTRDYINRSIEFDTKNIIMAKLVEPKDIMNTDAGVIGLDELHFVHEKIVDYILELYMQGREIYIAGLNIDANGIPWPSTQKLLCCPEVNVVRCFASCEWCGSRYATRTFSRLGNAGPEVGESAYSSVCFKCWRDYFDKQEKLNL